MQNAGLDEAQAGIKIAGRNINNLRYADDTTLRAESKEELKSLLLKVKDESENLAYNSTKTKKNKKTKIMVSGPISSVQFSSVQSLSRVRLFVTPCIAARQASLSITNSLSLPKLICIESVKPSNHLILCRPLLLLPPIPPSIRVFSNESTLCMK